MTIHEINKISPLQFLTDIRTGERLRFINYNESSIKGFALCETVFKGKSVWIPVEHLEIAGKVDEE